MLPVTPSPCKAVLDGSFGIWGFALMPLSTFFPLLAQKHPIGSRGLVSRHWGMCRDGAEVEFLALALALASASAPALASALALALALAGGGHSQGGGGFT